MSVPHRPVLLSEVLEALAPRDGGRYVDGTVGAGGHAAAILDACGPHGGLLGLDRDPQALELATRHLAAYGDRVALENTSYDLMRDELLILGWEKVDGVLLDLGVSSMQLDRPERGFAFSHDGPLDMRMGPEGQSAADLVNTAPAEELARVIATYGEERFAKRIARGIVTARELEPIATTWGLARVVEAAIPAGARGKRPKHPATQTFQALRMAVNDELGRLERFLKDLPRRLKTGGRVVIISYHSLEDRLVKKTLRSWAEPCVCPPGLPVCSCGRKPLFTLVGRGKAVKPGEAEIETNPRARSARLRAAERTQEKMA